MSATVDEAFSLRGRVCLISGAASGIGLATTKLFRSLGASVAAIDLELATEADLSLQGDAAEPSDVSAFVGEVLNGFGRVDVLVNNAGIGGVGDLEETSPELWDEVMRVNVRSVYLMCRAVVPTMIERREGAIVNVSSAIAETGLARRVSYAASKGAVLAFTKSLQVDCAPFGIRVNAVLPGTIDTPFVERFLREAYADPEEGLRAVKARQLLGELGRADDVAHAIAYLASDASRFVLGTGLFVDGGLSGTRR